MRQPPKLIRVYSGEYTKVSAIDYQFLNSYRWSINSERYVIRSRSDAVCAQRMHRAVAVRMYGGIPAGLEVDHINGDPLDNRRSNLRLVTHHQNVMNRQKRSHTRSPYKGVYPCGRKWRAGIRFMGVQYWFGVYPTPKEAGYVYDQVAEQLHGEFASKNFE